MGTTEEPVSAEDRATSDDVIKIALTTLSDMAKNGSTQEIKLEAAKTILQYYR